MTIKPISGTGYKIPPPHRPTIRSIAADHRAEKGALALVAPVRHVMGNTKNNDARESGHDA
jgi:hypothetical protein